MKARSIVALVLAGICCALAGVSSRAARSSNDGYLRQRVAILIFAAPSGGDLPEGADWILTREIRAFEAFLWQHSGRRLLVEAVTIRADRLLSTNEFLDRGPFWGHLPSPAVVADLQRNGFSRSRFDAVLLLYEPPAAMEPRVAGATYGPRGFSAIPLTRATFREAGRRYPLHLLLAHEFLHQIEDAFADSEGTPYLASPDDADLRLVLNRRSDGSAIDWRLLSPALGSWVPR